MATKRGSFEITGLDGLEDRAQALLKIKDITKDQAMVEALNAITEDVYETARGRMLAGINLTDAYLQSRMHVIPATAERGLRAEIVASGAPEAQTPLGRYIVGYETAATKGKSKGSPIAGVPAGQRITGVRVEVKRGTVKVVKGAFVKPLRAGATSGGNGVGVFTRSRYGIARHRYGPAVYQLFRTAAEDLEESIGDIMVQRIGDVGQKALERALDD